MEKIFVSVASYRDRRCSTTIMSLFEKAKFPKRMGCGIDPKLTHILRRPDNPIQKTGSPFPRSSTPPANQTHIRLIF